MLSRKTGYGTLVNESAIDPITEAFQYDKINRLTGYQMVGGVSGSNISTQVQYDKIGNITYKSDVGSYSYDAARPYRLTQVALTAPSAAALLPSASKEMSLLYDDGLTGAKSNGGVLMGNGNLRCTIIANSDGSRQARWQTYTSFNAPTQIALKTVDANYTCPANGALPTSPSTQLQFVYSPEHQRVKQVVTGGAQAGTTYYYNGNDSLDLSYEKTVKANGVTEHKHYISLPGSNGQWLLGQFVQRSGNLAANPASSSAAQEFNYFHQDAQGSTVAVSDANGQIQERMAYDPWGDRRNVTGPADPNNLITVDKTDRGYTQHEMLDEVGLVHMNGRIYDPYLSRMLTADILVSYPERSTSFNRYAYALNNPLRFIDPSGWEPWGSNEDGRTQFIGTGLQSVGNTYTGDAYDYSGDGRLGRGSIVSASQVWGANGGGTTPIAAYVKNIGNWVRTTFGQQRLASDESRLSIQFYKWTMSGERLLKTIGREGQAYRQLGDVAENFGVFSFGENMQVQVPITNSQALTSQLIASRKFDIFYSTKQLDKKFKHAIDFDLNSNKKNPETLNQFKNALEGHLANPNTREYGKYLPSEGSTVRYNPVTQRVMIIDNKLEFVSGWKLDPVSSQYKNYIEKGVLR